MIYPFSDQCINLMIIVFFVTRIQSGLNITIKPIQLNVRFNEHPKQIYIKSCLKHIIPSSDQTQ